MNNTAINLFKKSNRKIKNLDEDYYHCTANIKLTSKGKSVTLESVGFYVSTRNFFFAFWNQKDNIFQNAHVNRIVDIQKIEFDKKISTYQILMVNGIGITVKFSDSIFIDIFNKILSMKIDYQGDSNDRSNEYCRYLIAGLVESFQIDKSIIYDVKENQNYAGDLSQILALPNLKFFNFMKETTKSTLFDRRVWLGSVKISKFASNKSVTEIDDQIAKSSKPKAVLFVTSKQMIDFETEDPKNFGFLFKNVIDSLSLPDWMDPNLIYIFESQPNFKKIKNSSQYFPFIQTLAIQFFN